MKALCKSSILLLLLASCAGNPYHKDYLARQEADGGALKPFMAIPAEAGAEEREALEFLYAYMPAADVTDYSIDFYLQSVRQTFRVREEMGWNVPEREFRHFVLPLRVNNESLDSARTVFYRELKPRVQGKTMQEAILEVNHWCHEKVTYQPSDARTMSPLNLMNNTLGRCGEESTFTVTALRSVGIPARQVYTPRWAHTDDNHAWVEAWADGQWHFLGACEPEPVLDLGWFNAPASRAMLMHTKVFGKYDGPEEVVLESPNYTEVNLIDNYAQTGEAAFRVLWGDNAPDGKAGKPAAGARVDFCIYNYAEFYPAVTKYADDEGRTSLSAGLGDMLVWASLDGAFGYARVSFGKDREVTIVLRPMAENIPGQKSLKVVPPVETANIPEVTPDQRALNNQRFAREDSLRHAYEATFIGPDRALAFVQEQGYGHHMAQMLVRSRGNHRTIGDFMAACGNHERIEQVLSSLSTKDLQDITQETLQDYYSARTFLGARVEDEFLSPFYSFFETHPLPVETPEELVRWVQENITVNADPKAWNIPMSPAGVYASRVASPRSRDIFFVSAARALGMEARKDPVTGKVQYKQGADWLDVSFGDQAPSAVAPKGMLKLAYRQTGSVDNPKYYTHFTLSRLVEGRPQLLTFDEGEVDMGGGVDWAHVFKDGFALDAGSYLLVSGNRLADGSVPVSMTLFELPADQLTRQDLVIAEPEDAVPVIGSFDSETQILPADAPEKASILSRTGRGFYALAVLDPGKEPTNHVLRDLAAAKEKLDAWGRPVLLLCQDAASLARLKKEIAEGRYGVLPATVQLGVDTDGIAAAIVQNMQLTAPGRLPLVVLADTFNRVFFCSEGYTIGLGEQLSGTASRL